MASIEFTDCFHRDWINGHIRAGNISPAFKSKAALTKENIEYELGSRDKDVLVDWFQHQIEQSYMLSWADSDYMIEMYDRTYKRLNDKMMGYDHFKFYVESDNIVSLNYEDELATLLQTGM